MFIADQNYFDIQTSDINVDFFAAAIYQAGFYDAHLWFML